MHGFQVYLTCSALNALQNAWLPGVLDLFCFECFANTGNPISTKCMASLLKWPRHTPFAIVGRPCGLPHVVKIPYPLAIVGHPCGLPPVISINLKILKLI